MHIAIDASRSTVGKRTGTEVYSRYLIRALLALDPPHHITLYFRDVPPPDLFACRPARCTLKPIPFPRLWTHLRFAGALWSDRPDVTFVPSHTLPFLFPGSAVVTVNDLGYRYFPRTHTVTTRFYIDLTTRYSARRARHVIAISAATRRDLTAFYGIAPDKIHVVYPGIDPDLAPVKDADAIAAVRTHYDIPGPYLLYLGSIQPRKNLVRLIEAYAMWQRSADAPTHYLVLAGKQGWLYKDIYAKVRRLGLEGWVRFTGYVDAAHIAALYSGAAAFAFPSLYEGFGFPVLEAMRCGTPVFCANTSSLPEVAGSAALLVDPEDTGAIAAAMARITSDADLRARLGAAGYIQAARFTWEHAARATLAILEAAGEDVR